jgi:hypothetical protein
MKMFELNWPVLTIYPDHIRYRLAAFVVRLLGVKVGVIGISW